MDITVKRNAYGRQLGSFETAAQFAGIGEVPMVFIRGPYIVDAGRPVEVLARVDGRIVAARQENMLVTAFHPELAHNERIHRLFLEMAGEYRQKKRRAGAAAVPRFRHERKGRVRVWSGKNKGIKTGPAGMRDPFCQDTIL